MVLSGMLSKMSIIWGQFWDFGPKSNWREMIPHKPFPIFSSLYINESICHKLTTDKQNLEKRKMELSVL